jgi:sarcosine oxidase subunit gamma
VVELIARTPLGGLDITRGSVRLAEADAGPIFSLAARGGESARLSQALEQAHGLGFPAPGQSLVAGTLRLIWSGPGQALLTGGAPGAGIAQAAALTDQSDGWAVLDLSGPGARAVLARLVAVDLRDTALPVDATARCQLVHVACSLTRVGQDCWRILVFRSMARTAADEILHAMAAVAARDAG